MTWISSMTLRATAWAVLVFAMVDGYAELTQWSDGMTLFGWQWAVVALLRAVLVVGALDLWHYKVKQGTV